MTRYLTPIVLGLVAAVLSLPPPTALSGQSAAPQAIVGEVTDTLCAPSKSHQGMMAKTPNMGHDAATCTRECAKIGGKYVLLDKETGKVYQVDDQARIEKFAGRRVKVTGTLTASRMKVTDINVIG